MDRATLGRSHGPGCGLRCSGSSTMPPTSRTSITGTLIRKTEPHQKCSSSTPPTTGPSAAPAENADAQMPTAMLRSRWSGNSPRISARVAGAKVAPATPSSARVSDQQSRGVDEYAVTAEMIANAVAPQSNSFLWPIRSPRLPMLISSAASTNE